MNNWLTVLILLLHFSASSQKSDSLTQIFEEAEKTDKIYAAYELANYWYNQKNDSVLYYLDFIHNQNNLSDNDTIIALTHKLRGNLYFFEKRYEKAEKQYKEALKIFNNAENLSGAEAVLNNLGLVLLRQNRFDDAIPYLNQSIDLAYKTNDLIGVSKSFHNLAYVYELKSDYESALEYYLKALKLKRNFNDSSTVSRTLNNIGNIYGKYGQHKKALTYYNQSLKISEYLKDSSQIAMRYYNLSRSYRKLNNFKEAIIFLQKALDIHKAKKDTAEISVVFNSIGIIYRELRDYDKAIEYYQKALSFADIINKNANAARIYTNLADVYDIQNNFEKVHIYYNKAIEFFENSELIEDKINVMNNYGLFLIKRNKYDDAKKILSNSIRLSLNSDNPNLIVESLLNYSDLYFNQKKYKVALSILNQAEIKISDKVDFSTRKDLFNQFYKTYKKIKDYRKALVYFEAYETMEDSIFKQESFKAITELEKKYKLTEKEKEITLLTQQNKLQELENTAQKAKIRNVTLTRNFAIGGGALLLLLVFISFYAFLSKRKANNKLTLYNAEIIEQKEEILAQRDEIETQLKHIEQQNELLQTQKTHITDSITYAQYIQKSIFPRNEFLKNNFTDYFVFHQPKDIVSGDFYFGEETADFLFIGVIDCTGHGVPGAFMSMLSYNALRTTVLEKKINDPAKILYHLDFLIKEYTHTSPEIAGNGMDMVLAVINKADGKMEISGAKRPLLIARKGALHEIQGTKRSIGRIKHRNQKTFEKVEWQLQKNDVLYMFSDGYADQFGGDKTQKFKYSQLKDKLYEIQNMQLSIQKNILIRTFEDWKGQNEQIDDILVLGIKI